MRLDHIPTEALIGLLRTWAAQEGAMRLGARIGYSQAARKGLRERYLQTREGANKLQDELQRRIIALEASQGHIAEEEEEGIA